VDRYFEFAGTKCLVDVMARATVLPFRDNSLDYVASSHLFEHVPNPILTLLEWYRVLRRGGIIYMVIPDRRFTFDHLRKRTTLSHLVQDFESNTTACDPTHIEEFADNVDFCMAYRDITPHDIPRMRREHKQAYQSALEADGEINIHFHVFEKEDVIQLIEFMKQYEKTRLNWNIVEVQEKYPPNSPIGFLIIIRV